MGNSESTNAESQFISHGKEYIISKFHSTYWPDVARVEARSRGVLFIGENCKSTFVLPLRNKNRTPCPLVYCNDPFLCAKKRLGHVANLKEGKKTKATNKRKEEEAEEGEKVASIVDSEEVNMEEEIQEVEWEEEIREETEEPTAREPRKSKKVADRKERGKA